MNIFKKWIEDFKAHRRGEKRVHADKNARGRVYERTEIPGADSRVAKVATVTNVKVRVIRANGDIEEIK